MWKSVDCSRNGRRGKFAQSLERENTTTPSVKVN